MVTVPDSGSSSPGSIPGWGTALGSWAGKTLCSHSALSVQVYNWVLVNLMLGRTSIPSSGE